jgi:glycosyltransferase involved in cell wall biosynthesis
MPLISVVIPTFDRAWSILRALDSVLGQTYRDFEVWIIDDGSSDSTEELIKQRAVEERQIVIHYEKTPNRGVAAARNLGIQRSGGDWIALLDSDDEWMPKKLEKQVSYMEQYPGISLIHTGERWIRNGIRVNAPKSYDKFGGEVFISCLPVCMIGPSTAMFKKDLIKNVGGFDEEYPVCEDYDFWLRVTARYEAGLIDEALTVKYGGHPDQLSTTHVAMDYWRIRSMSRLLSGTGLSPSRREATVRELRRKGRILLKGYIKHGRNKDYSELWSLIRQVDEGFTPG